jgi:hypothetical protein
MGEPGGGGGAAAGLLVRHGDHDRARPRSAF